MRFDFADASGHLRHIRFASPRKLIIAERIGQVRRALRDIQEAAEAGYYAAGYLAYEAAPAFDPAFRVKGESPVPLLVFGIFDKPLAEGGTGAGPKASKIGEESPGGGAFHLGRWASDTTQDRYRNGIAAIKSAIAEGATYQVNYTMRLASRFAGDDLAFYKHLMQAQQASYCAYLNLGRYRILSASPELFFRWDGRRLITKPMKGTTPRGRWPQEDREREAQLRGSVKDRAENLMIVDLLRNDVGRISETGTVRVEDLFKVEAYPTVYQMTSQVSGLTPAGTTLEDVFASLFPSGSITGAPKPKTMGIIADLETSPRGVYCGTVGMVEPGGRSVFNVAIRTVSIDTLKQSAVYGVGGGITWDSTPAGEYEEAWCKAGILSEPAVCFDLLETLRLENGVYYLLERHLARLRASAVYFGFEMPEQEIRGELEQMAGRHEKGIWRVRLLMTRQGRHELQIVEMRPNQAQNTVRLARSPVDTRNRFLYHKTTWRDLYETHKREAGSVLDALLWNERGEVTEFTIGNVVLEIAGSFYTPPVESGLLAGTLREELLERGILRTRTIKIGELAGNRMWLINSVRGWVPVRLEQNL